MKPIRMDNNGLYHLKLVLGERNGTWSKYCLTDCGRWGMSNVHWFPGAGISLCPGVRGIPKPGSQKLWLSHDFRKLLAPSLGQSLYFTCPMFLQPEQFSFALQPGSHSEQHFWRLVELKKLQMYAYFWILSEFPWGQKAAVPVGEATFHLATKHRMLHPGNPHISFTQGRWRVWLQRSHL